MTYTLAAALVASKYACARTVYQSCEVIAGADDREDRYQSAVLDSRGHRFQSLRNVTLAEIEAEFPGLAWSPLLDNGAWADS